MLTINTNTAAQFAGRMFSATKNGLDQSLERLSSGLRINSAADDAAGLAISNRMTAQIRGVNQASRNINDGISLLQTAEGALQEVTTLIQRGRELAVQAGNGHLSDSDKTSIQAEIEQIKQEVNRIGNTTTFNGQFILRASSGSGNSVTQDKLDVQDGLRSGWLRNAEQMIIDAYGLTGNGGDMTVIFEEDSGDGRVAWVSNSFNTTTREAVTQELHIDLSDFTPVSDADGGTAPYYNDRIIAHEMVHAVMGVTMNAYSATGPTATDSMPTWFHEGAAELIQGADERLLGAIEGQIAGGQTLDQAIASIADSLGEAWGSGNDIRLNEQYASAFVAARFLHDEIKSAGGTGMDELMGLLSANKGVETYDLDEALAAIQTAHTDFAYNSVNSFVTAFTGATGEAYMKNMYTSGDLHNEDTGAILGLDADGGAVLTARSVVPNGAPYEEDPLVGFNTLWQEELKLTSEGGTQLAFQVGANAGERLDVSVQGVSAQSLNIDDIDVSQNAAQALLKFDRALEVIDENRGVLGAQMNRMEHAMSVLANTGENLTAARSRILDADIAFETAQLTKKNILQQAAISMLTQAQASPEMALRLLS